MKIVFTIAKSAGLLDKIIALATWGDYSHVELMFSDGVSFSSRPFSGVGFKQVDSSDSTKFTIIDLPVSLDAETAIHKWCEGESGCGYDYFGAVTLSPNVGEKWFCSEICIEALNYDTEYDFRRCMSPNDFFWCCVCKARLT